MLSMVALVFHSSEKKRSLDGYNSLIVRHLKNLHGVVIYILILFLT